MRYGQYSPYKRELLDQAHNSRSIQSADLSILVHVSSQEHFHSGRFKAVILGVVDVVYQLGIVDIHQFDDDFASRGQRLNSGKIYSMSKNSVGGVCQSV